MLKGRRLSSVQARPIERYLLGSSSEMPGYLWGLTSQNSFHARASYNRSEIKEDSFAHRLYCSILHNSEEQETMLTLRKLFQSRSLG